MSEATFAVIDTETTGLSPAHHHRIIEIAVVELDREGNELGHWTTLVNPERDVGASDIHGISPADLFDAPIFSGIAADLAQRLQGRIPVAHNLPFDLDFLVSEYVRLGVQIPLSRSTGLCTMRLAGLYLPWAGRSLAACIEAIGGSIETAHAALNDARAAAGILRHLLAQGPGMERQWPPVLEAVRQLSWPTLDLSPRPLRPRTAGGARPQAHFLSRLVSRMPRETIFPAADSYLALVDRVLLDRFISKHEEKELVSLAETLGLSREEALQCHGRYLLQLAQEAKADGIVTDDELADLVQVAILLDLSREAVEDALAQAESASLPRVSAAPRLEPGCSIVVTGDQCAISRPELEALARAKGLRVASSVSSKTRIVAAADPDSLSGKARKARDLGVPIVSFQCFHGMLEAMDDASV